MRKFILLLLVLLIPVGVAGAASINGDFEGNPIVNVKSNGQNLIVNEIPAMIYKDHTVVPLSMLRQLGVLVAWDSSTYSVNVTMPPATIQLSPAQQEYENLLNAYQWLKDTDTALVTFSLQLQQYANLSNGSEYAYQLNADFEELMKLYTDSSQVAQKLLGTMSNPDDLKSIIKSESNAFNNVLQIKNMLFFKLSGNIIPDFEKQISNSLLNTLRITQKNLNNTNAIIHELQLKNKELLQEKSSNTKI